MAPHGGMSRRSDFAATKSSSSPGRSLSPFELLPRERSSRLAPGAIPARMARIAPAPRTRRPHILWIDDAVTIEDASVRLLELEGFAVDCAQTGADGVVLATRYPYDVVLLDLRLEGESGLDVLQALTAAGVTAPTVMLTGYADVDSAVAAMKLGAADYRMKPLDVGETAPLLRSFVARRDSQPGPGRRQLTESDWLRAQCDRLAACVSKTELIAVMVQTLLDGRLSLRSFFGCAASLKLVLTDGEQSLPLLAARMSDDILRAASTPLPRHHKLRAALAALERGGIKQPQQILAGRIGLSRAYLSRMMTKQTGRHSAEWCRAAVARTAVRELLQTSQSVSQIAYAAGYEHVAQFDRDFAGMFGVSPTALRRLALP